MQIINLVQLVQLLPAFIPSAEDCDEFGDCSTQHGATLDSLHVEAPGSSHMSSNSEELRILSVHGKGEYPLAVDTQDPQLLAVTGQVGGARGVHMQTIRGGAALCAAVSKVIAVFFKGKKR